jgi:hypothetical protein
MHIKMETELHTPFSMNALKNIKSLLKDNTDSQKCPYLKEKFEKDDEHSFDYESKFTQKID